MSTLYLCMPVVGVLSPKKKKNQTVVFQAIAPSGKADAKVIEEEGQMGEMQAMRAVIESQ